MLNSKIEQLRKEIQPIRVQIQKLEEQRNKTAKSNQYFIDHDAPDSSSRQSIFQQKQIEEEILDRQGKLEILRQQKREFQKKSSEAAILHQKHINQQLLDEISSLKQSISDLDLQHHQLRSEYKSIKSQSKIRMMEDQYKTAKSELIQEVDKYKFLKERYRQLKSQKKDAPNPCEVKEEPHEEREDFEEEPKLPAVVEPDAHPEEVQTAKPKKQVCYTRYVLMQNLMLPPASESLFQYFGQCGTVKSVEVIHSKYEYPPYSAIIQFNSENEAQAAIDTLHLQQYDRQIVQLKPIPPPSRSTPEYATPIIFLGQFEAQPDSVQLKALFGQFGSLRNVLIVNREPLYPPFEAYVVYNDTDSAVKAITSVSDFSMTFVQPTPIIQVSDVKIKRFDNVEKTIASIPFTNYGQCTFFVSMDSSVATYENSAVAADAFVHLLEDGFNEVKFLISVPDIPHENPNRKQKHKKKSPVKKKKEFIVELSNIPLEIKPNNLVRKAVAVCDKDCFKTKTCQNSKKHEVKLIFTDEQKAIDLYQMACKNPGLFGADVAVKFIK